ncbi:MAG TPA: S1/P1 nuclease [Pyrinomonadaceae bacterium]|nr:S1/P1 nuclease [Pyrinomonadaceae bacterium]
MTNATRLRLMKPLLALALVAALPLQSFGWGAGGHMMTAHIAYTRLNPRAQAEVDRLVKVSISPESVTAQSLNFVNASHWADDLRPFKEFDFLKPLHFVDFPFTTDGTPLPPDLPGDKTILTALNENVDILRNSADDAERARALRLVIHFVGDIHQPLHASARVTAALPKGDLGGNLFSISVGGKKSNLHSYWDGGIGSFPKTGPNFAPPPLEQVLPAAEEIARKFPPAWDAWKVGGPAGFERWAQESSALAQGIAYRNIEAGRVPSKWYNQSALITVERRVAWGGYRLAELLNSIWPAG